MIDTRNSGSTRLSLPWRLTLAMVGTVLAGLLALAATLDPSPQGYGTHQQLGLPPCTFYTMYGIRCPSCGMTTAWAHLTHGNLVAAVRANAGGALLALLVVPLAGWVLVTALRGRGVTGSRVDRLLLWGASAVVVVTLIDWLCRLS